MELGADTINEKGPFHKKTRERQKRVPRRKTKRRPHFFELVKGRQRQESREGSNSEGIGFLHLSWPPQDGSVVEFFDST